MNSTVLSDIVAPVELLRSSGNIVRRCQEKAADLGAWLASFEAAMGAQPASVAEDEALMAEEDEDGPPPRREPSPGSTVKVLALAASLMLIWAGLQVV